MTRPPLPPSYVPSEIAAHLRVDVHSVLAAIKSGRLRAIDVRRPGASRPRYRITADDLADYRRLLAVQTPVPRARRRNNMAGVKQYV